MNNIQVRTDEDEYMYEYNTGLSFKDNILDLINYVNEENLESTLGRVLEKNDFKVIDIDSFKSKKENKRNTKTTIKGEYLNNIRGNVDIYYDRINLLSRGTKGYGENEDTLIIGDDDCYVNLKMTNEEFEEDAKNNFVNFLKEFLNKLNVRWLRVDDGLDKDFYVRSYEKLSDNKYLVSLSFSFKNPFYFIDLTPNKDEYTLSNKILVYIQLSE